MIGLAAWNSRVREKSVDVLLARWLVGPEGAKAIAVAAELSGELTTRLKRLRDFLSPEQAAAALEQGDLRERARSKFAAADRMYFTPLGLEQATDEAVARYKAERFQGHSSVFDLCTGIGGDLMALATVTKVTGHDHDEVAAVFAEANAAAMGHADVLVRDRDVTSLDLTECDAWHLDPDRRPEGRRTTRVELHEPSADAISRMLAQNPNAAIKLAPAASWPDRWTGEAEWEWISRGRQCRQLVAWFGKLGQAPGKRRATQVAENGAVAGSIVGDEDVHPARADSVDRFVMEPDVAVLAAQLSGALAEKHGLSPLAGGAAYLTGPQLLNDPLVACFEVEEVLPLDLKKLKSWLRERGVGQLEIKVRGVQQDPAVVRKRLGLEGPHSKTLLLTHIGSRHAAIVARRASSGSPLH